MKTKHKIKKYQEILEEKALYRNLKVFYSVFDVYADGVQASGTIAALKPSRNPGSVPSGRASGRCKPTASDFIADVELAAKAVLNPSNMAVFYKMADMSHVPDNSKYNSIADVVGEEFKRRGIYPLKEYFADSYMTPRIK
jgi:hypothetical protein